MNSRILRMAPFILFLATAACSDATPPLSPSVVSLVSSAQSEARSSARCVNVAVSEVALLTKDGSGAQPTEMVLGGISGTLSSLIETASPSGSKGQGALHITLHHEFVSPQGSFTTNDIAVCAPAGANPAVCRVNDRMRINESSGTGVFANAAGYLHNHGVLDFFAGTLDFSLRGRICGDGL